eukprot:scaffold15700_cov42-Phaeocystis_antarctica.AAC.1
MPLVSWGCHRYPEDTGVVMSIKRRFFVLPLNTSLKSRAGARVLAKVCESPPTTPRPPVCVAVVRGAPARGPSAAHTTAASPPRASAPHVQELRGRLALLLFAS